jgi:hypothetical protein
MVADINDDSGGGLLIQNNILFNLIRETADHGPINSWNRQVYLHNFTGTPSVTPAVNRVNQNFMLGNYNTQECVDNDDGSAYWLTSNNALFYSGNVLKSDFGGHSNTHSGNVALYVGGAIGLYDANVVSPQYDDQFSNNTVVLTGSSISGSIPCSGISTPRTFANQYYLSSPSSLSVCGVNLTQWQKQGNEIGSVALPIPSDDTALLTLASQVLGL